MAGNVPGLFFIQSMHSGIKSQPRMNRISGGVAPACSSVYFIINLIAMRYMGAQSVASVPETNIPVLRKQNIGSNFPSLWTVWENVTGTMAKGKKRELSATTFIFVFLRAKTLVLFKNYILGAKWGHAYEAFLCFYNKHPAGISLAAYPLPGSI